MVNFLVDLTFASGGVSGRVPTISGVQRVGETLTVDESDLSNVTSRVWVVNDVDQPSETGMTFDTTLLSAMDRVQVRTIADGVALLSPAIRIYMDMAMASHNADDDAILALIPHPTATHIAINNGDWETPSTWDVNQVPAAGATVLIPQGNTVTYSVTTGPRLHNLRIDGTLDRSATASNHLLAETTVITQSGHYKVGTLANPVSSGVTVEHVVSNRHYPTDPNNPTDLSLADDPQLFGRGILNQGEWSVYGQPTTPWLRTATGAQPIATDTSLTLSETPTNWNLGDEIGIGGTFAFSDGGFSNTGNFTDQTEIVTLTGATGANMSWSGGLAHDHDLQNPSVTRNDLQPAVFSKKRNVIFRSEDSSDPVYRRGHTMSMHMSVKHRIFYASFLNLGRTNKNNEVGVVDGTDFRYLQRSNASVQTTTLTAQSNLTSRYPVHVHFAGYGRGADKPMTYGCYVEDAKAWAIVHHGSEADFFYNVMHKFTGAGMVSETGDEIGAWVGNLAVGVDSTIANVGSPKNEEGPQSIAGDFARIGCGFFSRGRAMRVNGNMAMSCTTGYVYFHRTATGATTISDPIDPLRSVLDIGDLNTLAWNNGRLELEDYPIVHFDQNEAGGCFRGFAVTKPTPEQHHDVNINLNRFTSWAHQIAADIEYVGAYVLTDWDMVAIEPFHNANATSSGYSTNTIGAFISGNAQQISVVNATSEEHAKGIALYSADDSGAAVVSTDDFDGTDNPQFMVVNHTSINDTEDIFYFTGGSPVNQTEDVTRIFGSIPTPSQTPSFNIAFPYLVWNGSTGNDQGITSIVSGTKTDNVGDQVLPKLWDRSGLKEGSFDIAGVTGSTGLYCYNLADRDGYWTDGGKNILLLPYLVADRLTARPARFMLGIEATGSMSGFANNGSFTRSSTSPSRADIAESVAQNGSVTFNVLTGATGEAGATLRLWDYPVYKPNFGEVTANTVSGEITYTPDSDFTGTDFMYAFIYDGRGSFATVRIDFTIS